MTSSMQTWVRVGNVTFGKGVFAKKDIPAGTVLGKVQGRVIDDPDYATSYCIDLGGSLSLEPRMPFRYLNHCCAPNSALVLSDATHPDGSEAPPEVIVESLTEIPAGAEVTIDYQWAAFGAIKCLCGSSECRGWIVAEEELHKLQKTKGKRAKQLQ